MFFEQILGALLIAAVLTAVFGLGFRREGFGIGLLFLFVLLFLFTWAGGIWIPLIGPGTTGTPWLPFLVVGILLALLWAALAPYFPSSHTHGKPAEERIQELETATVFNVFFWILVAGLAIVILVYYL